MVVVEAPQRAAPASTEAGAIRDARRRQALRRKRVGAAAAGLASLGLLTTWLAAGGSSKSAGRAHARFLPFERAQKRATLGGWRISPSLEGGSYGWCIREDSGGSCATLPTDTVVTRLAGKRAVSIGTLAGNTGNGHEERITALLSSSVHAVLANGRATTVVTHAELPYGLRLAEIDVVRASYGSATPPLLAVDTHGKPLGYLNEESTGGSRESRWWQKPARGAPGPCQIRARGLRALEPEWGHVAAAIHPYPTKIIGRAFFSCADTEYYLHNWPLVAAILLDAQHPGSSPAAIPGMKQVTGASGLFDAPGDWHGDITAMRHANAWLVVAGGSGLSQRIDVLPHVTASIALR
jgi:hypothetical protein